MINFFFQIDFVIHKLIDYTVFGFMKSNWILVSLIFSILMVVHTFIVLYISLMRQSLEHLHILMYFDYNIDNIFDRWEIYVVVFVRQRSHMLMAEEFLHN